MGPAGWQPETSGRRVGARNNLRRVERYCRPVALYLVNSQRDWRRSSARANFRATAHFKAANRHKTDRFLWRPPIGRPLATTSRASRYQVIPSIKVTSRSFDRSRAPTNGLILVLSRARRRTFAAKREVRLRLGSLVTRRKYPSTISSQVEFVCGKYDLIPWTHRGLERARLARSQHERQQQQQQQH